ncbi:hypothetical protein NFI96_016299 [Prochilodus magdalenae]|nr:hypothetical protein NFI96_016299 [Prochilodus magdalenae]
MMDKPKIHVFLGAPHPSSLSDQASEEGPLQWKTQELFWSQGSLRPRKDVYGPQRHSERDGDTTPKDLGGIRPEDAVDVISRLKPANVHEKHSLLVSNKGSKTVSEDNFTSSVGLSSGIRTDIAEEAVDRLNPTNEHDKNSFSASHEANKPVSDDDSTPSISQSSLAKQAKDDFCPGVVTEYLDSCFPSPQPGPSSDPVIRHPQPIPAISVETEYLTVWTKSQGLLLRGRAPKQPEAGSLETPRSPQTPPMQTPLASVGSPELCSPEVSPGPRGLGGTLQGSIDLFCGSLSQRHQEGCVVLECTPDGILCSQAGPPGHAEVAVEQEGPGLLLCSPNSPVETSPAPSTTKRAKLSPAAAKSHLQIAQKSGLPLNGPTTLLSRCRNHGVHYSILVAVVHPWHLKEIKVRSGASAGSSVALASLIVTDQSGVEMKVMLWRTAAFWTLTVYPGDILLITGVTVHEDKWRGETVLQSSYISRLLNLGQVTQDRTPQAPHNVNIHTLRTLCTHLYEKHPLLVSLPLRTAQDLHSIPFTRLGSLRPDTLVHALLRVKHTRTIAAWRDEAEGVSRTGSVLKAVLTVEQEDGRQGAVVLWGSALSWLQRLHKNKDAVWEFRLFLVKQDMTSGLLELHSTPWSSCQPLFPDDTRCRGFYNTACSHKGSNSFEIDLHTLLSQKYTGDVELRVQITAFQFHSSPSQEAVQPMDRDTPLERILGVVCGDITFPGCGRCWAEVDTDENGIYRPCYPCLPHTGVRRYYRPAILTVKEGEHRVCVQVPPILVQKILITPPDKLNKPVAPASEESFSLAFCLSAGRSATQFSALNFLSQLGVHRLISDDRPSCRMAGALSMDETQYPMKMFDDERNSGTLLQFMMDISYQPIMLNEIKNEFVPETVMTRSLSISVHGPYLQIIEEPKQRGFRFRYECEGPSHGGLPGASSERNRRTYPTVKVCNYVGHARVEVQLVTHTEPPRVHAHSLVGKHCNENGMCSIDVGPNDLTAQFSNLGILHVTKRGVFDVLIKRLREEKRRIKEPGYHFTDTEEQAIVREAKDLAKTMDLNIVRLKFTAYLQDSNGGFTRALKPVVSNPIYDSKSPNASNLKISRMDKTCGTVMGGDEIFLLCDKVQKDDIDIRFYEEDDEGGWEAFGDFSPTDVHKQYAIVFKTPPYHKAEIERPVTVFLQLKRKKGGDCSEPKQFTYIPQIQDKEEVQRKRMKSLPHPYDHWRGPQGGAGGLGRGAGGFGGPGAGAGGGGMGGGFQFNHQLDGTSFYTGGCGGFGGGAQMSGASPQTAKAQEQPTNTETPASSPEQQRLLQIATVLQNRTTAAAKYSARVLLEYCSTGDVRLLLALQRQLCGVQDENGDTPLHLAIIHQQPTVAHQLIQIIMNTPQNKFINRFNHLSQTPLHLAVITKQPKLVEALLRVGADPSLLDRDGRTAVHLAANTGDDSMLKMLLGLLGERHTHLINTADFSGMYPVHLAVRKGGERCLRVLVDAGAKINMPEQKSGCTALHLAVKENLFKVACTLITELKADVNACTFGGNSPLHLAASLGSPPLCSVLIAAGADKRLENDEPLFCSSSSSDEEEVCERRDDEEEEGLSQKDMVEQVQDMTISSERCRVNPRKRPAAGHTPFDLANCQKVKDLLDGRTSPKSSHHLTKKTKKSTEDVGQSLDDEMVSKLCGILIQSQVPWRDLAEKLGMLTLADLYQKSPSPCQKLLETYKISGGPLEGLVDALESLGLSEGVRILRASQPREDKQSTDTTVDSGFGSQEAESPAIANH